MPNNPENTEKAEENGIPIPFRFHPRVFAALGADLVTSDLVAVIELVKNSYDAFTPRVDVRFLRDSAQKLFLEIEDNGLGMNDKIIENVWCVVATPFRADNPTSERQIGTEKKQRRVSGAKGLGRLSVARLGEKLELFTKQRGGKAWKVTVEWNRLADAESLDSCTAFMRQATPSEFLHESGTLLRVTRLHSDWPENELDDLADGLSRLKPPFKQLGDFKVFLTDTRNSELPIEIKTSEFINNPVYQIKGRLTETGLLTYQYYYQPYSGKHRPDDGKKKWENIVEDMKSARANNPKRYVPAGEQPICGPFEYEIRAWDLDPDSVLEASKKFNRGKSLLRSEIRAFKGVSVYRDQVLVLPKSETARDWLGLDLRRVSKVGTRISTSQIVGYVGITAESNPAIVDTSDRERLTRNDSVREFECLLQYVIEILENKRDEDRPRDEIKVGDLFQDIDAEPVILEAQQMAKDRVEAAEILPALEKFGEKLQQAKNRLERTFGYYNRLATIGTLAQMLVHEVGNNNLIIGHFMTTARAYLAEPDKNKVAFMKHLAGAEIALQSLERLAERFIPLASQGFRRARRQASVKDSVETCREAREKNFERFDIKFETHLSSLDKVKIDPGELHAVILNLMDNAIYWLSQSEIRKRCMFIKSRKLGADRLECKVMDSGPGIEKGDENRIFLPGVTKRPNGFGMGLTVVAEIIEGHGGKIYVESPGDLKGATFVFDLPLINE